MTIAAQLPRSPSTTSGEKVRAALAVYLSEIEVKAAGAAKTAAVSEASALLIAAAARLGVTLAAP